MCDARSRLLESADRAVVGIGSPELFPVRVAGSRNDE
jgi:hypothetical protein